MFYISIPAQFFINRLFEKMLHTLVWHLVNHLIIISWLIYKISISHIFILSDLQEINIS